MGKRDKRKKRKRQQEKGQEKTRQYEASMMIAKAVGGPSKKASVIRA